MCVILSIYQDEIQDELNELIVKAIEKEKRTNSHGVGLVAFNRNQPELMHKRQRKMKDTDFAATIATNQFVNIHLRQATSGGRDESNVHYWRKGNWLFAHNGIVYGKNYEHDKKCDSLIFFEKMLKEGCFTRNDKIDYDKTRKLMNDGFIGRFTVINSKTRKIYYFGGWHIYLLNEKMMVVSSTGISFKKDSTKFFGMEFEHQNTVDVQEKTFDGIFYIDTKTKQTKYIRDKSVYKYETRMVDPAKAWYKYNMSDDYDWDREGMENDTKKVLNGRLL